MISVGPVTLTVRDLSRAVEFYGERIGLRVHSRDDGTARLGTGGDDLLVIEERKDAVRTVGTTGLFHTAILLPSRGDLARALARLIETSTPLQGASDHRVSESLYLADPEGNGIELYRDRARESWAWRDGLVDMITEPLDLEALLADRETDRAPWSGLPAHTTIGHVHLRVAHIAPAERFFCDVIGFELTARYGSGASFVASGGYHHHVAFNTWAGIGAPRPPLEAAGLKEFAVRYETAEDVERALARARSAGASIEAGDVLRDPSGNAVRLLAG